MRSVTSRPPFRAQRYHSEHLYRTSPERRQRRDTPVYRHSDRISLMVFANPRGESMNFSGRAAIQPRVGVSVDSVSRNTGDRAIRIAVEQELSRRGIEPVLLNPLEPTDEELDAVIVGGGDLIRPRGDAFYERFRAPRGTILNAAGVWEDADELDYLRNYSYVSARSRAEVAILERHGINAHVLP